MNGYIDESIPQGGQNGFTLPDPNSIIEAS